MAAEDCSCSLNGDIQLRHISSDVIQASCKIGGYSTFEKEALPVERTKKKNRKMMLLTFCAANFLAGTFYSLLAPFFAIEVSRHLHIVLALLAHLLLS